MRAVGILLCLLGLPAVPATAAELAGTASAAGKNVQYAVVWLEAPDAPAAPAGRTVLDQRNLTFSPHVLVVRVGTAVDFPNNDTVFHNVFSFRDGKKFDLGMYPKGSSKRIVFDRAGLARLFCNIHPNMTAYVMAVDSPYFAVSNERGAFTIEGVPPGTYTYRAWRPGAQELTGSVTVDGTGPLELRW